MYTYMKYVIPKIVYTCLYMSIPYMHLKEVCLVGGHSAVYCLPLGFRDQFRADLEEVGPVFPLDPCSLHVLCIFV